MKDRIVLKSPEEIERMGRAGRAAAEVLAKVAEIVQPGRTSRELNDAAAEFIKAEGGKSAFLGYRGYTGQICVSVNEEVVHGLPTERRIQYGDIVSLDVGVLLDEFIGDTATTVAVGAVDWKVQQLMEVTERSLYAGISAAKPGNHISDISGAVQKAVEAAGFSVVREFVGHGVGRKLHEDPQVPNYVCRGVDPKLVSGMTLAIEPMTAMGEPDVECLKDGWTVVTRDHSPSAHYEHTIAITEAGAEILTCRRKTASKA